jgi:putative hydroxymethylpyrimidine transport system substrate-binding protein
MSRTPAAALLALLALIAAGCGSSSQAPAPASSPASRVKNATLVLDFTPNAVHAGIYSALARHYDRDQGVRIEPIVPSASTDSIRLLETGRADFAILDIHDLAIARERGADIVGIMAIVERPLAAVIAAPQIRSPRQLEGTTVGITGVPSDTAVLHSIVAGAGGLPSRVRTITIGFNAVADLLAGRVPAATAFWNDEGVTLATRRPGFHSFRVEDYGAPAYPELVLCATGSAIHADPGLARAVVRALVRGYEFTLAHPQQSASELESLAPGLDRKLIANQLAVLLPALRGADGRVGTLGAAGLQAWAAWETRFGIVPKPPNVSATFDPAFAAGA